MNSRWFGGPVALGIIAASLSIAPPPFGSAAAAQPPSVPAPPAPAPRRIRLDELVNSSLDPARGRMHEDYVVHLEAFRPVRIDLRSPAGAGAPATMSGPPLPLGFDTFLEVRNSTGATVLSDNDDRGDGTTDSRLIFIPPFSGDYVVRARPLGEIFQGEAVSYSLLLHPLPNAPEPTELSEPSVQGLPGDESPVSEAFGEQVRYESYWFQGAIDERILLELLAVESGMSLQLLGADGRVLASAIARGRGYVQIVSVLPGTGRYSVLVQSPVVGPSNRNYTLRLSRAAETRASAPEAIGTGQAVAHELTLASNVSLRPNGSIESFYRLYSMEVRAGDTITVLAESQDFDPLLEAGSLSVLGFRAELIDHDGGNGNNALLVLQPAQSGTVYIRVRSTQLGVGRYSLETIQGMPPRSAVE